MQYCECAADQRITHSREPAGVVVGKLDHVQPNDFDEH